MTPSVKSSRWSKIIIRTIIVLVVLGGLGWGTKVVWKQISPGLFGNKRQEKMPTSKVRTATIAEEIVAVGRLRAVFSTELRSEINGRIVKILAVDGKKVKKDQEILRLAAPERHQRHGLKPAALQSRRLSASARTRWIGPASRASFNAPVARRKMSASCSRGERCTDAAS